MSAIVTSLFFWMPAVVIVLVAGFYVLQKSKSFIGKSTLIDEIIDASDHGHVLFDTNDNFFRCNKLAIKQLKSIIGSDYTNLTQSEFLDHLYDHAVDFDENIKSAIMNEYDPVNAPEFREVISIDGGRLCLVHARPLSDEMILFTLIDISTGRQREENIRRLTVLNYQLMQAIQSTATGIIISDPKQDGNPILFVNDAFCKFTESEPEDLVGGGWDALMAMFSDKQEKEKFIKSLANMEGSEIGFEKEYEDNNKQYYTMTLSPVYNEGHLDLFIGLLSDVTLLKQREAEFFQAQKLESLGQLAAGIAHDFNNILSIIGGYSTMLTKLLDDSDDKVQGYLQKIGSASNRGAELTRKMLTFSRHKIVAKSCIDVRDIVNEQSSLLLPLLGVNISMDVQMPDHDVNIMGSASSIGQILMNLAINARDAMPEGGELLIELTCHKESEISSKISSAMECDEYVCLSVSDTGIGMDSKTVDRIFDPFFSTKEQGKGTGLGLSVVYGLVNELGGVVDVVSEVGRGTKMYVFFPRSFEEKTKVLAGDLEDIDSIKFDGYTLLVAEDEPDLLDAMKSMLDDLGFNVLTASNGDEALIVQEDYEGKIDILLTDVIMPEINGVKLAELLTSLRPETEVIFMSGYPANGNMAPVELPEGATFMAKPVDYEKIVRVLYQKLNEKDNTSELVDELPYWETSEDVVGGQS